MGPPSEPAVSDAKPDANVMPLSARAAPAPTLTPPTPDPAEAAPSTPRLLDSSEGEDELGGRLACR